MLVKMDTNTDQQQSIISSTPLSDQSLNYTDWQFLGWILPNHGLTDEGE